MEFTVRTSSDVGEGTSLRNQVFRAQTQLPAETTQLENPEEDAHPSSRAVASDKCPREEGDNDAYMHFTRLREEEAIFARGPLRDALVKW